MTAFCVWFIFSYIHNDHFRRMNCRAAQNFASHRVSWIHFGVLYIDSAFMNYHFSLEKNFKLNIFLQQKSLLDIVCANLHMCVALNLLTVFLQSKTVIWSVIFLQSKISVQHFSLEKNHCWMLFLSIDACVSHCNMLIKLNLLTVFLQRKIVILSVIFLQRKISSSKFFSREKCALVVMTSKRARYLSMLHSPQPSS